MRQSCSLWSKVGQCLLKAFHCVPLHPTGMFWSHVHAFISLCSSSFHTCFPVSSDWIISLCLSLILSVGWLNISAWFGVQGFFWGWEYFDYLHEIPCLLCTGYMWNWQLQGGKWMPQHFRGRIISCNYPKSAWENRLKGMRERKKESMREDNHNTSTSLPRRVWKSITLTSPLYERCRQIIRN